MQFVMNVENGFVEYLNSDSTLDCYLLERGRISKSVCETIKDRSHGNNAIYFLFDRREPQITEQKRRLYVGETTNVYNRMIDHDRKKDWWTHALVFTGDQRKISEVCIMALERLLIDAFEGCQKYDLMNSQSSAKDINGDYDTKLNYIFNVLDTIGYSLQTENNLDKSQKDIDNASLKEKQLYSVVETALEKAIETVKYDQWKLYRNYYTFVDNRKIMLFALWPNGEAEFYASKQMLEDLTNDIYDITSRRRGNRQVAMKIKNNLDVLVSITKRIIEKHTNTEYERVTFPF